MSGWAITVCRDGLYAFDTDQSSDPIRDEETDKSRGGARAEPSLANPACALGRGVPQDKTKKLVLQKGLANFSSLKFGDERWVGRRQPLAAAIQPGRQAGRPT